VQSPAHEESDPRSGAIAISDGGQERRFGRSRKAARPPLLPSASAWA